MLSSYLDDWLEAKKHQIKASTYLTYGKTINLIIKQFPQTNIANLKRAEIKIGYHRLRQAIKTLPICKAYCELPCKMGWTKNFSMLIHFTDGNTPTKKRQNR